MTSARSRREEFEERAERLVAHPFTEAIDALERFPYPTLAMLPGHTIGGGLELALACDLRVAKAEIKLGMPPAKLGLVYSHTGLRRFIDAIGAPRTRELFLLGRYIDAATALQWGLVTRVAPEAELEALALGAGAELAGNAPLSQTGNKRVIAALLRGRGQAGRGGRRGADRAAPRLLRIAGHARGDARVRRETPAALAGPLARPCAGASSRRATGIGFAQRTSGSPGKRTPKRSTSPGTLAGSISSA